MEKVPAEKMMERAAAILLPLFSLRSDGDLGRGEILDLKPFGRWMLKTGHHVLQLLPLSESAAAELTLLLAQVLADTDVRPASGRKIVEVKPTWASKANAASWMLARLSGASFRLAAGDDRSDEEMFASMPPASWTVHVGVNSTMAKVRVPTSEILLDVLSGLLQQQVV